MAQQGGVKKVDTGEPLSAEADSGRAKKTGREAALSPIITDSQLA